MTFDEALHYGINFLHERGVPDPAPDARRILAYAGGVELGHLIKHAKESLEGADVVRFYGALRERALRRPVAQIVGGRYFFEHWFEVTRDVLDPRPETETLVAAALEQPFKRALDLGTGSGCILLSLLAARPDTTGVGIDKSRAAVKVAMRNAKALGVEARAEIAEGDWYDGLGGQFDLVVSNPPYIAARDMADLDADVREWEPHMALTDGGNGLSAYQAICAGAETVLAPGGRLMVEIGVGQAADVHQIFAVAGLEDITRHTDFNGRERVVAGRRAP